MMSLHSNRTLTFSTIPFPISEAIPIIHNIFLPKTHPLLSMKAVLYIQKTRIWTLLDHGGFNGFYISKTIAHQCNSPRAKIISIDLKCPVLYLPSTKLNCRQTQKKCFLKNCFLISLKNYIRNMEMLFSKLSYSLSWRVNEHCKVNPWTLLTLLLELWVKIILLVSRRFER